MFSSTPNFLRHAGVTAALALAITTPVAGAGVDRGIGVPPSKSQQTEPYSDAIDRYLRNNAVDQTQPRSQHAEPYSDAIDRYLRNNTPAETHPDALARFLANDLRTRGVIAPVESDQPQSHGGQAAETRSDDGPSWTAVGVGAALALALIATVVATRRRFALRNV